MRSAVGWILVLTLVAASAQTAAAQQGSPAPDPSVTDTLLAARARTETEVIVSATFIAVSIVGAAAGSFALGVASERYGTACSAGGSIFDIHLGSCTPHDAVVGHDDGLLAGSLVVAGVGILGAIVAAVLTHIGRRRLREIDLELAALDGLAFGVSPDGAIVRWETHF